MDPDLDPQLGSTPLVVTGIIVLGFIMDSLVVLLVV